MRSPRCLSRMSVRVYSLRQDEAVKFLVHFLGDIHQPLHVGFRSDLVCATPHMQPLSRRVRLMDGVFCIVWS